MRSLPIVDGAGATCDAGATALPVIAPGDPATRRGTFSMVSLGCPKNLVDGERMLGLLRDEAGSSSPSPPAPTS